MIWFYPLNAMEVSGYEVFLLVLLSPILMGPEWIRQLIHTKSGLGFLRIITVTSVASFQAPDTLTRLAILAGGNFCNMLVLTGSLWSNSQQQRYCFCLLTYTKKNNYTTHVYERTLSSIGFLL
jgi:hypothetical protein